jgi:hypothetical protein
MSKKPFHAPLDYNNRMFGYYLGQIDQQRRILQQVRQCLPDNLAKHACHCLISANTLLVYTDSAIWASQLRFYHPAILGSAAGLAKGTVTKIQVKIMTQTTGAASSAMGKTNIPSLATLEIMQKQSGLISDQTLQNSLQRLNATLRRLAAQA